MSDDAKKDDAKADEKADDTKADDTKADDTKADDTKADDTKAEDAKAEDAKAEADEAKAEDAKAKAEDAKAEDAKADDAEAEAAATVAGPSLGYLVEFETEESLMAGAAQVRDAGYTEWDAHTPYPVHGLDQAMGIKPTILPWIVLGGGLTGCMVGLILQCYTNGIELPFSLQETLIDPFLPSGYQFVTSGKPIFSIPANIPVTFELTILLSAFGAFFGMWGLNKLPRFYHPVFRSERFRRATDDRFFISIEAEDALYDRERTRTLAESLGGSHVEELVGEA